MFNPTSVCILPTSISLLIFLFYFQETKNISGTCVVLDINSPSFICSWKFGAAFVLVLALEVLMYIHTMFVMKELFLTYCETLFFDSQVSKLPKQIGNSEIIDLCMSSSWKERRIQFFSDTYVKDYFWALSHDDLIFWNSHWSSTH